MSNRFFICCTISALLLSSSKPTFGQEENGPAPDREAISAETWEQPRAEQRVQSTQPKLGASRDDGGRGERVTYAFTDAYYSRTLRAHFLAQWMYITERGQRINFWGARIVHVDHDSPIRQLGLNSGDVISRLDGIPIWRDMYREEGRPWQIVEMENHYGRTEVRYILRGSNRVRIGDMMLDGSIADEADDISPIRP